jgi:type I restriction enzyme R subunit
VVIDPHDYLAPEAKARMRIDEMLQRAGWTVQDYAAVNLSASRGVAVREFVLETGHGRADYLLFVDGCAVGVIEAKKEGQTLTGVEWQSAKYLDGLPDWVNAALEGALPFAYESTGTETRLTNTLDPDPRSRAVYWFLRPATIDQLLGELRRHPTAPTLRHRLRAMPELDESGLWPAQATAIRNLEVSLAQDRPRALIQMATGSGKTFAAANIAYRLVRHADARRVLFLVDRANLGRQTLREFQGFTTPDDGRKFTELYNVQHLSSNTLDPVARVTIATIQRVYSMLRGDPDLDPELDERSPESILTAPVPVDYNPTLPPEAFDIIVIDECHRSIFGVWRQVLDYFDAHLVGLTATPNKQAFAFFDRNLVMEYTHEQAVADAVNVDFDVYRIRTKITEAGATIDAGTVTQFRDRQTRAKRWETLDEDLSYTASQLDRDVVAKDQIRTVIRTFHDRLFSEIFPGRSTVPKTLIFAKDDAHADDIVQVVREEFGKGNDFAVKITYRSTGRPVEEMIKEFRNSPNPRVAVTVDMIATGTDVRPLECVFFMRSVKSRTYFEQMKGRGVRVIGPTDFRAVTPDAEAKERFVIVDAVGVTETNLVDTQPLDREPGVLLQTLMQRVAFGARDPALASTIAARLVRLDRRLAPADRDALITLAGGRGIADIARGILDALDPDTQVQATGVPEPTDEQIAEVAGRLIGDALAPLADNPELRQQIVDVRRNYDQVIDEISPDEIIWSGYSQDATDRARSTIESFERFIDDNRDEITALQVLYARPFPQRLTFDQVRELARAIGRPPQRWTPAELWTAYEILERDRVRGSGQRVLTDIVSLVRFALHQDDELVPYPDRVRERFQGWLAQQRTAGREFTDEQLAWLERICDQVATSLGVTPDDFAYTPFVEHGGLGRAAEVFGDDLRPLLDELTEVLAA